MKIKTVEITELMGGGLKDPREGMRHVKALPCLSVVQSVHGWYGIGLDGDALRRTEEGGAFVAPSGVMQEIVHHNGRQGYMEAQWVFMHIRINGLFDFEDVFTPPYLIPPTYGKELNDLIATVRYAPTVCRRYAAAYGIADILFALSQPKEDVPDSPALLVKRYVEEHYAERITKEALASAAHCSTAGVYRLFRRQFKMSPNNYINKIRLEKASVLLEQSDRAVSEVGERVGFEDPVYFSKLFKARYGLSPGRYRDAFPTGDHEAEK